MPETNKTEQDQDASGQTQADEAQERRGLTLWQTISSAFAAALGVQTGANRERDFKQGKASHFIAVGIVFTIAFVVGMVLFVQFVLSVAAT